MSAESNFERAEYWPRPNMSTSRYFDRATMVLNNWSKQDVVTINDAIEVYQCKLIAENYGEYLDIPDANKLKNAVSTLFGASCRLALDLVQSSDLAPIFDSVELQYKERLWDLLDFTNLWDRVSDESFGSLLTAFPYQIPYLLASKQAVNRFGLALAEAMRLNVRISAEAVIHAFGVAGNNSLHFYRPDSLTDDDLHQIMLSYLKYSPPEANLNHVRVLALWPSVANDNYNPSPEVRVAARRRAKSLEEELFPNPEGGIRFGSEVQFSAEQRACKKMEYKDKISSRTYGLEWLQKYVDPPTVLNNFLYVFDLVGRDGILNCSSHPHTESTLSKAFGLHPKNEYRMTFEARAENMALQGELFLYEKLLLEESTRLEDAVEWFFNNYIKSVFGVAGFSVSLPTEGTSWLDKCKAIGPEIERVLKAFRLYAQSGSIDTALFEFTDAKNFGDIPSLLNNKYLIEGEEFDKPANLLLNDQSRLAYTSMRRDGEGEFCRLVERHSLTECDFHEIYRSQLQYLIDSEYVTLSDNGTLGLTMRARLVELVWKRGAALSFYFSHSSGLVEKLVSERVLKYSNTLFSPDEADYMSYLLNNAKFSNALALRNKYDHGSGAVSDLTENEMKSNYFMMLAALIGIVLKVNEELSRKTEKGGLIDCDLVDWPLTEEEDLIKLHTMASGGSHAKK